MTTGATLLAACLMLASQTYNVPPAVMVGIMQIEGGKLGQEAGPNVNGTYDLGPMQINTMWLPMLARHWKVDTQTARAWVRDNGCVNMHVSAWILHNQLEKANGSLYGAIARYHSATPSIGGPYAAKVVRAMAKKGLIDYDRVPASLYNHGGGNPKTEGPRLPVEAERLANR